MDEEAKKTEYLRHREGELVSIIEALGTLEQSAEWSTLKKLVFDGVLTKLANGLLSESQKMPLDDNKMYHLQGQIAWAKKYADLGTLLASYRAELQNIRKQLL